MQSTLLGYFQSFFMAFIKLIMTLTNIPHEEWNAYLVPSKQLSLFLWIALISENSTHRNHLLLKALFTLRTEKLLCSLGSSTWCSMTT